MLKNNIKNLLMLSMLVSSVANASPICSNWSYWGKLHKQHGFPVVSFEQDIRWSEFEKDGFQMLITYEATGEVEKYTVNKDDWISDTFLNVYDVAQTFPCLGSYAVNIVMLANMPADEVTDEEVEIVERGVRELKAAAIGGKFVKVASALTGLSVWAAAAVSDQLNNILR